MLVAVPHAPQLCNRSDGQVWEQLEQLLVKGLQRAGELLGKHNEFSVITGTADLMGQSKSFGTVHRNGLREEQALRCQQVLNGIIQRQQARSEIVQMNVTELANPKRGKSPILFGRSLVLHGDGVPCRQEQLDHSIGVNNYGEDSTPSLEATGCVREDGCHAQWQQ